MVEVDVILQKAQKSAKNIGIRTKTKLLSIESSLSDAEKLSFRGECLKFYAAAVTYLQDNLPFKVSLIKHAQTYTLRKEVIVTPLVPYQIYA